MRINISSRNVSNNDGFSVTEICLNKEMLRMFHIGNTFLSLTRLVIRSHFILLIIFGF